MLLPTFLVLCDLIPPLPLPNDRREKFVSVLGFRLAYGFVLGVERVELVCVITPSARGR